MRNCPHCDSELEAGVLIDTVTGQRGYYCRKCDATFSAFDLKDQVIE